MVKYRRWYWRRYLEIMKACGGWRNVIDLFPIFLDLCKHSGSISAQSASAAWRSHRWVWCRVSCPWPGCGPRCSCTRGWSSGRRSPRWLACSRAVNEPSRLANQLATNYQPTIASYQASKLPACHHVIFCLTTHPCLNTGVISCVIFPQTSGWHLLMAPYLYVPLDIF